MNLLALTYWSYKDPLIQTYTLPYLRIIKNQLPSDCKIFLVTFEQGTITRQSEEYWKIAEELGTEKFHWVPFTYHSFGISALFTAAYAIGKLWRLILREEIDLLYGRCTPGGALAYILSRLTGRKFMLDSFEPHAEAMVESRTWKRRSLSFQILFHLEKLQAKKAQTIIACVPEMKEYIRKTYKVVPESFHTIPACINLKQFNLTSKKDPSLVERYHLQEKIVCVYAGKFDGLYLGKECFDFFAIAEEIWGDRFRVLLLSDHSPNEIERWARESHFDPRKILQFYVSHEEIPAFIGLGDFGLTPFRPIPSKRYGSPIKTGEYWAMGLPVVITPNISDDSAIISNEEIGAVIPTLNKGGYYQALKKIAQILSQNDPKEFSLKIRSLAQKHRGFHLAEDVYKKVFSNHYSH